MLPAAPAPQEPPAPPEPEAPPAVLGHDPPGAATDGDLAEWASATPVAKLASGGARARGWASITRGRVRFALDVKGEGALGEVRFHVALPPVKLPRVGQDESTDGCVDSTLGLMCGSSGKPCHPTRAAVAHCKRFVPRSREIRERLGQAFRRTYTVRGAALWAGGSEIAGSRVVVRRTSEGVVVEGELPSEALPRAAQAPLASVQWAFEISLGQRTLAPPALDAARPESYPEAKIDKPVRFGAIPALLEHVGAPFHYAPGPATSTAVVIGRDYDAPEQVRAIVELPVDVSERTIIHRAGARSMARLVVPTLQGPGNDERLLVLDGGDLVNETDVPGTVIGHGALGGRYAVLAADLSMVAFHFHALPRTHVSVVWFDSKLDSSEIEPLLESGCRGVLGQKPSVRGLSATLHCTTGGYDSDEPLRRLPPRAMSVRWSDAKKGYVVSPARR